MSNNKIIKVDGISKNTEMRSTCHMLNKQSVRTYKL